MGMMNECERCGNAFTKKKAHHTGRWCSRKCHGDSRLDRTTPEPDPVAGARWIPVGHGRHALVDEQDFQRIAAGKWVVVLGSRGAKCVSGMLEGRRTLLHTAVSGEAFVDHRNGDVLDNRRSNLRAATPAQNVRNGVKKSGSRSSRYKGVWWSAKGKNWQAMIRVDGARRWLGGFDAEEAAALAYDTAAREHHGEFACVNFPRAGERAAVVLDTR